VIPENVLIKKGSLNDASSLCQGASWFAFLQSMGRVELSDDVLVLRMSVAKQHRQIPVAANRDHLRRRKPESHW
jgi:hypothetical protein